jgi:LmbE family N-acetylglucosaminyl deacetylase
LSFSNAWQSLPEKYAGDKRILIQEQKKAAIALGIPESAIRMFDIPVRNFPEYRQEILEILVKVDREFNPDIVFCASVKDLHQDHATLAQEAQRAFKKTTLLGYILPWNIIHESRTVHVEVAQRHVDAKMQSVRCYNSQKHRNYFAPETLEIIMRANGIAIGVENAETFELIKSVERL